MTTSTEVSVTWAQALAWRMERQLLDPVGTESVAGVVRRLGAVLSMVESLAELAVRTRRTTSRPGQLATALAEGKVIKAFAFRGSMHYLSPEDGGIYLALRSAGRQWLDESHRSDQPIEQEAARLAGILGHDLHVRLTWSPDERRRNRTARPAQQ
jgi:hypothetical protein